MAIRLAMWLGSAWWKIRGVGVQEYRALCSSCQCTGQMHWNLRPDGKRLCSGFRA